MPPALPPDPPLWPEVIRTRRTRVVIALFFGAPVFLLLLVIATAPLWQPRWVEPLPGVRIEPSRPFLAAKDVKPDSAYDLLSRACALQDKVKVSVNFNSEMKRLKIEAWSEESFPSLAEALEASAEALALARRAIAAPDPRVPTSLGATSEFPALHTVLQLSELFDASAARAWTRHDAEAATEDSLNAMRLSDLTTRGSALIPRLVDIVCTQLTCTQLRCFALREEIPPRNGRALIEGLQRLEREMEPWAEGLRAEAAALPKTVDQWYDPNAPNILPTGGDGEQRLRRVARVIGPAFGSSRRETLENMRAAYSHVIRNAELPYDAAETRRLREANGRPESVGRWLASRDPFGRALAVLSLAMTPDCTTRHYVRLADLRATAAVLAIRQFQQVEGHPPAALAELVPRWLPAVPVDPFDGAPFRYRANADGSWKLYSVGPDQKDDGGIGAPPTTYLSPNGRGDRVYLSTEGQEERARQPKVLNK